jgi:hypothetical protein
MIAPSALDGRVQQTVVDLSGRPDAHIACRVDTYSETISVSCTTAEGARPSG